MHETHVDLEQLKKHFTKDAFVGLCGIELIEAGQGFVKTLMLHSRGILAWHNFPTSTGPLEGANNKIKPKRD